MTVDRAALVARHRVVLTGIDGRSPLAVGNGEFAFTVDVTGLQSLPGRYPLPDRYGQGTGTLLATMTQWAWHSLPPRPEQARGAPSLHQHGPVVRGSMIGVLRHVDPTIDRLGAVETDERIEQVALTVERLRRIAGRTARSVHR